MLNKRAIFLLFAFLINICTIGIAQILPSHISTITTEEGLPDNWCHSLSQDAQGFMWLGTQDGLSRYDGTNFKTYQNIPGDTTSISGNIIMDIVEDKHHKLWIAVLGGGLNVFDPITEKFESYLFKPIRNNARCLLIDQKENIWIGSWEDGLQLFDAKTKKFQQFNLSTDYQNSEEAFRRNSIFDIIEDVERKDILWIAGNNGLFQFNTSSHQLKYFPVYSYNKNHLLGLTKLWMEDTNSLWIGSWGSGLVHFDLAKEQMTYYPTQTDIWPNEDRYLDANIVYGFEKTKESQLLIATNNGIHYFDFVQKKYVNPTKKPTHLKQDFNVLFVDKKDNKWLGINKKGILLLPSDHQQFTLHQVDQNACNVPNKEAVIDFAFDKKENHYLALRNNCDAFDILDLNDQIQSSISFQPPIDALSTYTGIAAGPNGDIWVSTREIGKSLYFFDHQSQDAIPFDDPLLEQVNLHQYAINDLVIDQNNSVWLGTSKGGLIKLNLPEKKIKQYLNKDAAQKDLNADIEISQLLISKDESIWLSTYENGVYQFDPSTENFIHYPPSLTDSTGLIEGRINSITESDDGLIWVGCNSRGVQIIDPQQQIVLKSRTLQTKDGLVDNNIRKIIKDQNGNIWISTYKGLCQYDMAKESFLRFGSEQGIQNTFLHNMGLFCLPNGKIFLGQENAYYSFHPDSILQQMESSDIIFTDFKVFGVSKKFDSSINFQREIILDHHENFFSISFAALNYAHADKYQYAYRLEGFDKQWNYLPPGDHVANYTNVGSGQYTLKIKAANSIGHWNEEIRPLKITLTPPWWKTWWAYLLFGLILLSLLYLIYYFLLKRKLAIEESRRLRELDELKTRFYTNITHEFRTPLTIIMGMADQIKNSPELWLDEGTSLIKRNGNNLLQLVNQMLDLQKLASNAMPINLVQADIIPYIDYIIASFQQLAHAKSIQLHKLNEKKSIIFDFDPEKMLVILSNLITNAIKFTPNGGNVYIQTTTTNNNPSYVVLKVIDDGKGISKDQLPFVFDRFFQGQQQPSSEGGTGIGLAITKEMVKLHKGTIQVESEPGRGTSFTLQIPISTNAPQTKSVIPIITTPSSNIPSFELSEKEPSNGWLPNALIIEDNQDVITYLQACLQSTYNLSIARDGSEGINQAIELVPDIIISDVMMPKKDGFEVCSTLKKDERTSHIPIILLTAKASIEDRLEGLKLGADAYLAKPFDERELSIRLKKLIEIRQQLQLRYKNLIPNKTIETPHIILEDAFILRVRKAVEDNLSNETFGVQQLCKAVGMSRTQLHNKLKALTQRSTSIFIRSVRLKKAQELLKTTDKSISEIAYLVGFKDPNYFSRTYFQEFGEQPSRTRK